MDFDTAGSDLVGGPPYSARPRTATGVPNRTVDAPVAERLQDLVLDSVDLVDFLEGLCAFSATLASVRGGRELECAITVHRPRRPPTIAGSTERARTLAGLPACEGDGPCLAAQQRDQTVVIENTAEDGRWPGCSTALLEAGIHGVLAVPLSLDEDSVAVVCFLSAVPRVFTDAVARGALRYAAQLRKAILLAVRLASKQQAAEDLQEAMASRTAIDLAVGVIMGQQRCSQEDAFAILARASSTRNQKLRIVAEELVQALTGKSARTHFEP